MTSTNSATSDAGKRRNTNETDAVQPFGRQVRVVSPSRQVVQRFLRHRLAVVGLALFVVIALMAIFAPLVAQHSPTKINLLDRNLGPTAEHWFGTDRTGRDTFARTVYAGRVSISIGIVAVVISGGVGALLGSLAGFFGGIVDSVIMRFTDMVMTFPPIVILLTLAAIAGPGIGKTMLIIGLLNWPVPCRLVRSKFLALREQDFVLAAEAIGAPKSRVIIVHAFPNVIDVLIVYASLGVATAILLEAGLSFLGLGVQPPTSSWGNMLNVARNVNVLEHFPWQWMPAGGAIVITVLAVNFVGDGLRDAFDPRTRR